MESSSPEEVLRYLCAVFPSFEKWWKDAEREPLDTKRGFHCIMAELIQFFGMNHQTFSEKQLRRFGRTAAVLSTFNEKGVRGASIPGFFVTAL